MFHFIILKCFEMIKGERSISSVYHLLTGKKSTQTLQDSAAFNLENYFGIYHTLNREHYNNELKHLYNNKFIQITNENVVLLTEKGKTYLNEHEHQIEGLKWLNGYKFEKISSVFWKRVMLFIQTCSNILNGQKEFIPIVENDQVTRWTRHYFKKQKKMLQQSFSALYEELYELLKLLPDLYAEMLVARLTGYKIIGLSHSQIAEQYKLTNHDIVLIMESSVHLLLSFISKNKEQFNILRDFIPDEIEQLPITNSAQKSNLFYTKGFSLQEIAKKRGLKLSTIHDHFVELAVVDPNFKFRDFVSSDVEKQIFKTLASLNTKRLKLIKDKLPEDIDYFTIRLVLVKYHREKKRGNVSE